MSFKIINPKLENALTPEQALTLEARVTICRDRIHFLAIPPEPTTPISVAYIGIEGKEVGYGMEQLFWEYPLLALPYKSSKILIEDGSPFVVIPEDLFDATSPENWLALSTNIQGRKVLNEVMPEERLRLVYSIDKVLYDFCQRSFSIPQLTHTIVSQCTMAIRDTRRGLPHIVSAYIDSDFMQLVVAGEGKLLLANRYSIEAATDSLYYITALYRHFNLNPQSDPTYIYTIGDGEEICQKLSKQISHVALNPESSLIDRRLTKELRRAIHPLEHLYLLCEL